MMEEVIKLIVDNGTTVAIIVYFMFVNYNFMTRIDTALTAITELLKRIDDKDDK